MNMNRTTWIAIIVVLLVILGGVYLLNTQPATNSSIQQTEQVTDTANVSPAPSIKTFEIEGKPFEFSMKEIKVNQGDTVRINFKNTEGFHDWTVDEFNARTKQINVGETDTIEFVANQKGTFEYYCSVGNHRQMGMVGNLVVD